MYDEYLQDVDTQRLVSAGMVAMKQPVDEEGEEG